MWHRGPTPEDAEDAGKEPHRVGRFTAQLEYGREGEASSEPGPATQEWQVEEDDTGRSDRQWPEETPSDWLPAQIEAPRRQGVAKVGEEEVERANGALERD